MIKSRHGVRIINCSFCDNSSTSDADEFIDCIDEWKDEGWRMFKKDDAADWTHICPSCREANKMRMRQQKEDRGGDFD